MLRTSPLTLLDCFSLDHGGLCLQLLSDFNQTFPVNLIAGAFS
ncbi:hypothetical protein ACUXST_002540 [Sphingomonas sp. F9_3S_D5_B_2]